MNNGYIFINLLPYRAQVKKEKIKQFTLLMLLFSILSGIIIFICYSIFSFEIEKQKVRNEFIAQHNKKLAQDIKSIAQLQDEIKETLAKRKVVENLQINRSDVVEILNTISQQLPDGMTLKSINEINNKITITGTTTSNNKVSNYMTNLALSNVLVNPELVEIKSVKITNQKQNAKVKDDQNINEFILNVYLKSKPDLTNDEVKNSNKK